MTRILKEQNEETKDEQNIQIGGLRSETIDQELRQESDDSLTKPRNESLREEMSGEEAEQRLSCLLYTSPSPRDGLLSRMPSSA